MSSFAQQETFAHFYRMMEDTYRISQKIVLIAAPNDVKCLKEGVVD